jgi:hypothetical protein
LARLRIASIFDRAACSVVVLLRKDQRVERTNKIVQSPDNMRISLDATLDD